MGRSRYTIHDTGAPHFITCTVLDWIPLFSRPDCAELLLDALHHRQHNAGWRLYGYVIMENHLHAVVQAPDLKGELPRFKSYTARRLLDHLEAQGAQRLLAQFAQRRKHHKGDRDHQLWEEGSHPQQIGDERMLHQKLEYIHLNPVKRGYVDRPEHWRYSSARNYAGAEGLIPVFMAWP